MYVKAILWGFFLFGLALVGEQARMRFLQAKLDAAHYQDSPLRIHESGTLLKYTPQAEFEFPLDLVTSTAYRHGYSNALLRYLSHHRHQVVPYWKTPEELRFELDLLTQLLIKERVFTVVNTLTGQRHAQFRILPENERYQFAYAFEDGPIFYEERKWNSELGCGIFLCKFSALPSPVLETYSEGILLCSKRVRAPAAPILSVNLEQIGPDLSLDFLSIIANPDPTVY